MGQVTDVSHHGMCVFVKGAVPVQVGQELPLEVTVEDQAVSVRAVVKRVQPCGLWRHEVGLAFEELGDEEQSRLTRMLRHAEAHGVSPRAYRQD